MDLDKEVHRRMASFCQGTLNVELEDRTNKPKAWTYSPDSQTITDFIISGHFRLTSGRTSDQNFISGTFYCTKSGALKFQGESFWICFDTVVIDKDISEKQPLGRNLPKSDATVKNSYNLINTNLCLYGLVKFIFDFIFDQLQAGWIYNFSLLMVSQSYLYFHKYLIIRILW